MPGERYLSLFSVMKNSEKIAVVNIQKTTLWSRLTPTIVLVLLVLSGIYIRFFDLTDPPLDFHPTRQLHSLIIARGFYYQFAPGLSDDQRQAAMQQSVAEGRVEPPILEWIVARTYSITGGENPVVARVYSIVFWLAGALLFYFLSREYLSDTARLIGTGFILLLPYGVYASRAFQPDPLMTAMCILCWFLFAGWVQKPVWRRALLVGVVTGLTLLIKTTAVFYLAGVFVGVIIATRAFKTVRSWQTPVMLVLFALPTAIYAAQVWFAPASGGVTSLRFFPSYWTRISFYLTWYGLLDRHIGLLWIVLSLIGGTGLRSPVTRGIFWGGLAGYVLMGFVLPHHISTHDYYILPLIPLLALGLAGLVEIFQRGFSNAPRAAHIAVSIFLAGLALGNIYVARNTLNKADYRQEPEFWQGLARQVAPYGPVVGLTQDYGLRMTYWGGISLTNWDTLSDIRLRTTSGQEFDLEALFEEKTANAGAFLVTMADEFARQPELRQLLDSRYPQVSTQPGVWLYDLRTKAPD